MCYMSERQRVGVRELRQNLSKYLRRIEEGEILEVTDRGVPVAVLGPLPEPSTILERLIAEGKATPARGHLRDLPPPEGPVTDWASRALEEQREERLP